MAWVEIEKIEVKFWKGKEKNLIYFRSELGELRYVEFSEAVCKYWRKFFKNPQFNFKVGMLINVFRVPNQTFYTIKGVQL